MLTFVLIYTFWEQGKNQFSDKSTLLETQNLGSSPGSVTN